MRRHERNADFRYRYGNNNLTETADGLNPWKPTWSAYRRLDWGWFDFRWVFDFSPLHFLADVKDSASKFLHFHMFSVGVCIYYDVKYAATILQKNIPFPLTAQNCRGGMWCAPFQQTENKRHNIWNETFGKWFCNILTNHMQPTDQRTTLIVLYKTMKRCSNARGGNALDSKL